MRAPKFAVGDGVEWREGMFGTIQRGIVVRVQSRSGRYIYLVEYQTAPAYDNAAIWLDEKSLYRVR